MIYTLTHAIALNPEAAAYHAEMYPEDYAFIQEACRNYDIRWDSDRRIFLYHGDPPFPIYEGLVFSGASKLDETDVYTRVFVEGVSRKFTAADMAGYGGSEE